MSVSSPTAWNPRARAVVFLHGGGQTRRSWGRAAAAVAERGWQAVTIDLRAWRIRLVERRRLSVGQLRRRYQEVLRNLPGQPALVGASLGGFAAMLLAGALAGHCQRSGAGGHRAEYGPGRGEQDPRVHGRTGGIGVRLVGRGG
ncbi:alpha/beta fold hydrolase [Mycobacterium tuberculosis]